MDKRVLVAFIVLLTAGLFFAGCGQNQQTQTAAVAYEFEVVEMEAQPMLAIHTTCDMEGEGAAMEAAFGQLMAYVESAGLTPAGPPFTIYSKYDSTGVEMDVGMPFAEAVAGNETITAGTMPAGQMVKTVHHGCYAGLGDAHMALMAHMEEGNMNTEVCHIEVYITDPTEVADTTQWITYVYAPVETVHEEPVRQDRAPAAAG